MAINRGFLIYGIKRTKKEGEGIKFNTSWKTLVVIVFGLVAGIGTLYFARDWVSNNQETVNVPVPAQKISANTIIQADDLTQKPYIKAAVSSDVEINPQKIIGKAAVTDLYPGELILKNKLKPDIQVLKPGEVFVTVKAESLEQVLGGNICRNMIVDVIYTEDSEKPPVILAENAIVVAVMDEKGKSMAEPVAVAQAAVQGITGRDRPPQYIMLKVKRNESYEFTKPLNGGHILITQVGEIRPEPSKVEEKPKASEVEPVNQPDGELPLPSLCSGRGLPGGIVNNEQPQEQQSKPEQQTEPVPQRQTTQPAENQDQQEEQPAA